MHDELQKALQVAELDQPGYCSGIPAVTPPCASTTDVAGGPRPEAPRLRLTIGQNPVHGATRLTLQVISGGPVRVGVYDIRGMLVKELSAGWQTAGTHVLTWDATHRSGARAASGLYYVRAVSDAHQVSHPLLLVR